MFTPIKNFITYIQKNASSNSIFGGNSTTEESAKMETENIKTEAINVEMQTECKLVDEIEKKDDVAKEEKEEDLCERTTDSTSDVNSSETRSNTLTTTSTVNGSELEEDDIEEQIESSIMLKKPVKVSATKSREILELKKSSNASGNIVITHDFDRNHAFSPIDDELEDFMHDPMEVLGTNASICSNQPINESCSVESAEGALENPLKSSDDFPTEDDVEEVDDSKTEDDQKEIIDSDLEAEENDIELNNVIEIEEESFLDLDNFKSRNVIVLDEVDLNTSTASVDTYNTSDDPLAIACEDQEEFATDKATALEELNFLNHSQTSQDDDTTTTTDDDLRWLKTDIENNQASSSINIKINSSEVTPEKEERNGEGSDSGLGNETSALHTTTASVADSTQLNVTTGAPMQTPTPIKPKDSENILNSNSLELTESPPKDPPKPYRSNLKRRLELNDSVDNLNSLTSAATSLNEHSSVKKQKRSINFDNVQVFYFPRQQGYSCVPSAGGCTLGMGARHIALKTLTLAEHAAELRRAHRMQLHEINPRGSSSDDSEESEEDYLSEGSGSDLDGESNGFLQPVSPKQRRALLKAAGIRKIDPSEKAECRNIRNSREVCGCTCRDFCDPETCTCSQSGIKCQVDRDMFPCGCSRDACGNAIGRVEFNPTRVRTHYIHTLMRLEMENRQQQNPYSSVVASAMQPTPSSYYQTHLQTQSNYSSGYASPAYNTAPDIHQHSAAGLYYHTQTPSTSNSLYGQQTLEMTHNASTNSTTSPSHYGIDSLDSSMFGSSTGVPSSYGELMPVSSYHYGNMQAQTSPYNTYHNTPYINAANSNTSLSTSNTYSSCAVPSIPPFGAATTTEAAGVYHSVSSLTSLETTTAPSCSASGTTSLENDASASFISLSTPLASSSRLSQINDLLQHNRNAATALVAVTQNIEAKENKSASAECLAEFNCINLQTESSSLCSSLNTPPAQDDNKSGLAFEEKEPPLKMNPEVTINQDSHKSEIGTPTTTIIPETAESLSKRMAEPSTLSNSLREDDIESSIVPVSATTEPSPIEVLPGN